MVRGQGAENLGLTQRKQNLGLVFGVCDDQILNLGGLGVIELR